MRPVFVDDESFVRHDAVHLLDHIGWNPRPVTVIAILRPDQIVLRPQPLQDEVGPAVCVALVVAAPPSFCQAVGWRSAKTERVMLEHSRASVLESLRAVAITSSRLHDVE